MVWTAFQRGAKLGIQFISGIVLARLLTPHDYGCIGMLAIFITLSESFIDGGFGSALIQKKRPTQTDYSTIFWWNIVMAVVMYAIIYASAPAIARFYGIPVLSPVLRVQGIILIIYALNIIQRNQLKKNLQFRKLSIVSVSTAAVSLMVTIFMAFKGFGVWALVVQNLLMSTIPMVVFWITNKWAPSWTFSWQSFKELFGFGFYMFLTHLLERFSGQISGLLIGKVYDSSTLGYYSKAMGTEALASHSVSQVMSQVTYPLYAEVQDDRKAMQNMIRRLTMTISYITFPAMFILMLTARPIFILLYSERWIASIPYFQILCLAGLAGCLQSANLQTISAIGRSRTMFIWTVIKRVVGLAATIGGLLLWGIKGLLIGVIFNAWFSYFVNISLVSKYIGYKSFRQLLDIAPVVLVSLLAAAVSFFSVNYFHLSLYVDGALKLLVYATVYLGWSLIFKPEAFTYALTAVPEKFRVWERFIKPSKIDSL